MDEIGIKKMTHFEKFYGIPRASLCAAKSGTFHLGTAYWHIIFEKINPKYGVGFIGDYTHEILKGKPREKKRKPKKKIKKITEHNPDRLLSL